MTKRQAQEVLWSIDDDTTPEQIEVAIEAGGDPNAESPNGRDPMMIVLEDLMGPAVNRLLAALMEGGAHPLEGNCAFDRAMSNGTWSPIQLLADKALREDWRTDEGGTVLHVACRQQMGGEQSTALLRMIEMSKDLAKDLDLPPMRLESEVDENGNTPLHVLWLEGVAIERREYSEDQDDGDDPDELAAHWYATSLLMKEGAQLDTPNREGQTVLQLIHKALNDGFPKPTDEDLDEPDLAQLLAAIDHQQLDVDTPAPHASRAQGPRL